MDSISILSVPHIAYILGISIPKAQKLVREGVIRGHKTAHGWYATRSAVEAYQAQQQAEAQRPKKSSSQRDIE